MMLKRVIRTGEFVVNVRRRLQHKPVSPSSAQWLKAELQAMGPTYIKIGQFISSRRDIFDAEIIEALRDLQDAVAPAPRDEIIAIIKERLGSDLKHVAKMSMDPVAAASIGQVHVGQMHNGTKFVVKVRRPGVQQALEVDVAILKNMLSMMGILGMENTAETQELLDDFKSWFENEMDYTKELANYRKLLAVATVNHNSKSIVMPRLYDRCCQEDFIVMSYLPSMKIRDAAIDMTIPERADLATSLMDAFVSMLVGDGVMHGDPHEGNVGIVKVDGMTKIVLYDMGNVISIDHKTRVRLKQLLFEIVSGDYDGAINSMKSIDLFEVRDEDKVRILLTKYSEYMMTVDIDVMLTMAKDIEMRGALPIKFSGMVFRIVRVFGLLEGLCKDLDPEFTYKPIMAKYMKVIGGDADYVRYRVKSDVRKIANMVLTTLEST